MMKKIIISFFLTLAILSCKKTNIENPIKENNTNLKYKNGCKDENFNTSYVSFTLDCGSGCAMIYNQVFNKNDHNSVKIKYKVTQYIDEKIEDEYFETYIFESDENRNLISVHLDNNKDNILKDNNSMLRDQFLEIGNKLYSGKLSDKSNFEDTKLVNGNEPYNLIVVPFDLKDYVKNLPDEIQNSYSPTEETKKYLVSIGYEGGEYKCFILKSNNKSTEIIVSVTRGDSEYFLLIKNADYKFLSYKEIGSIGSENTKYFKINKNYNVVVF